MMVWKFLKRRSAMRHSDTPVRDDRRASSEVSARWSLPSDVRSVGPEPLATIESSSARAQSGEVVRAGRVDGSSDAVVRPIARSDAPASSGLDEDFDEYDELGSDEDDVDDAEPPTFSTIALERCDLSDDGRLAVVGESYYQQALRIVASGRAFGYGFDEHLPVTAVLVPEPENPHDSNAVRVDVLVDGQSLKVGYLSRENARSYQPHLLELRRQGRIGMCPARVTGGGSDKYYGIYLHVADALCIFAPAPDGPDAFFARILPGEIILKPDWSCTVTGEEYHQELLRRYRANSDAYTKPYTFDLDFCVAVGGKYRGQRLVEVRLFGDRVGQLTMAMTDRYAAMIGEIHRRGCVATCYGYIVNDERRGYQVTLSMPRDPAPSRRS